MISVVIVAVSLGAGRAGAGHARPPDGSGQRCTLVWAVDVPAAYVAALDDQGRRQTSNLAPDGYFALDPLEQRISFGRGLQEVIARQREDRHPAS